MSNLLLDRRTPSELAARAQVIDFEEVLAFFPRLAEIVGAELERLDAGRRPAEWQAATIKGQLEFGFADAQKRLPAVRGRLMATVDAVCQRCLEPMQLPLDVDVRLLFADGEAAVPDPGRYDVWETEDALLRPLDLVEENLIMAMPFAARHDEDTGCREPETAAGDTTGKTRPFADLKAQMEGKN